MCWLGQSSLNITPPSLPTMLADDDLDRAAGQIADGEAVDWPAVEGKARAHRKNNDHIASLRIVDTVARAHRALPPDLAQGAGRTWGRYRLTQVVGAGSYGSVYRAFDPELEREVAIKILHRQVGGFETATNGCCTKAARWRRCGTRTW